MRRILVTGGAGFIGANFVHRRLDACPADRLVVLDALTYAGNRASLAGAEDRPNFRFVQGDIADRALVDRLLAEEAVDTIVHFAAESHVDRSIHGPGAFLQTNVFGTYVLLEAARHAWLAGGPRDDVRFHHVSTDEVYGSLGADDPPFTETTPYAPNSPYAATKASSDLLVRAYHHTYGLPTTTSNCSNNYGPYQFPEKLIPLALVRALAGEPIPVYGDGQNVRDWLFVGDHCLGVEAVIERGRVGETYNLGGRAERRNIDLVRALCAAIDDAFAADPGLAGRYPDAPPARGRPTAELIRFVADRPGHDRRYAVACDRAERELGFRQTVTFEDGLRRTIDWYLANDRWWRAVLDGSYRDWMNVNYGAVAGSGAGQHADTTGAP